MTRVVLDTNVLVGSAYKERSSSRTIVDACSRGQIGLVVSSAVLREYQRIVPRAVRRPGEVERIEIVLDRAERVEPLDTPRVVTDDPEDDKFLAVAVAAQADALVTNDQHLLSHDPYRGIRIVRPGAFCERLAASGGNTDKKEACSTARDGDVPIARPY